MHGAADGQNRGVAAEAAGDGPDEQPGVTGEEDGLAAVAVAEPGAGEEEAAGG